MRLYIDLDLRQVVTGLGVKQPLTAMYLTRGDALDLELQFTSNGIVVDPGTPSVFFCIKPAGVYDGAALVLATDFTKIGSGTTAYWVGQPNLNTADLDTALGVGAPADIASLAANGEIGYTVAGRQTSTRAIKCVIENDLYRGDETVPSAYPTGGVALFYPSITALTGGTSANLDAIPTLRLSVGVIAQVLISGVLQIWQLQAGTTAEDVSSGIVHGDDYAATTNEKVWVRLS